MAETNYTPLLTNLTPDDRITEQDLEIIFNLPDSEIERIAALKPDVASNQYKGRTVRDRITGYLVGILLPSKQDNEHPRGLTDVEQNLAEQYIRERNVSALYDFIINRTSVQEKVKETVTNNFKYVDRYGHFRAKKIPIPDKTLGPILPPRSVKGSRMTPIPQDMNKYQKPTNSAVFRYLTTTRGLSEEMVKWLIDNRYVYQGEHKFAREKKSNKRILVINGYLDTPTPTSTPVFQSARETWDIWDDYHTSQEFMDKCKEHPEYLYKGRWIKDEQSGEFQFLKKQKARVAKNADGTDIKDSEGKTVWEPVFDDKGQPVWDLKTPNKEDNVGSDKDYSWRFSNPQNSNLYVFEAPIDCWSFIDMMVSSEDIKHSDNPSLNPFRLPNGSLNMMQTGNFLALGGINMAPLDKFLYDNPHIKKIVLCLDNDNPGVQGAIYLRKRLIQQYGFAPDAVRRCNCPKGYQKLDAHNYGLRDAQGNFVEVKDYNELLRAFRGAGNIMENMCKLGEDHAKDNEMGKYGTQEYKVTQKVKQAYTQAVQNQPGAKASYDNIPAVPEKRGGITTAELYRDETRVNMRQSVINSFRDNGLSAGEAYQVMASRGSARCSSARQENTSIDAPQQEDKPLEERGEER